MREPKDTDFFINLDGVGTFRYGRRTFLDRTQIRSRYLHYVKDLDVLNDPELSAYASIIAVHKVLCVEAPKGWDDIEDIILDEKTDKQIFELFRMVAEQEELFRPNPDGASEDPG